VIDRISLVRLSGEDLVEGRRSQLLLRVLLKLPRRHLLYRREAEGSMGSWTRQSTNDAVLEIRYNRDL